MTNKIKLIVVGIVIVVLAIIGYLLSATSTSVTAVGGQLIEDNIPYYRNNGGEFTELPKTIDADVDIDSLIVSGGTLNVTTSNTATSTLIAGCYQFYATSTATAHKYQATTTPGPMITVYGTCPNL